MNTQTPLSWNRRKEQDTRSKRANIGHQWTSGTGGECFTPRFTHFNSFLSLFIVLLLLLSHSLDCVYFLSQFLCGRQRITKATSIFRFLKRQKKKAEIFRLPPYCMITIVLKNTGTGTVSLLLLIGHYEADGTAFSFTRLFGLQLC